MGASKKKDKRKSIKQKENPPERVIKQAGSPESIYSEHPAWRFSHADREKWSIFSEEAKVIFDKELLPFFRDCDSKTWGEILLQAKKQNHSIDINALNTAAIDRLNTLEIEAESIISLRVTGTHRIYGYMNGFVFYVLWVDLHHGDNSTCVCRSHKKHT